MASTLMQLATAAGALCCAVASISSALAQPKDPKVPSGKDPGGFPVAVVSAGIDYTDPAISGRLARDGEGEIIGYDMADNDARPYAGPGAQDAGTDTAKRLAAVPGLRLIPIRVTLGDPVSVARGAAFASQTPARVVALPPASRQQLELLAQVAARANKVLFLVAPVTSGTPDVPPNMPENILDLATSANTQLDGAASIEALAVTLDRLLGCAGKPPDAEDGAAMKKALLAVIAAEPNSQNALQPCPGR